MFASRFVNFKFKLINLNFGWLLSCILLCSIQVFSTQILAGNLYPMPKNGDDIVGENYTIQVQPNDSVTTIRQRYQVSYHELLEANPNVDFYHLIIGQDILIPTKHILPVFRQGIVINTAELRLYYFSPDGKYVYTCPVGLGRMNWRTPTSITKVTHKQEKPTWYVPKSIKQYALEKYNRELPAFIPPGPDNPLGNYAIYLAKQGYLLHGTNEPDTVGTFSSSGCMRFLPDDIETLYQKVAVGTPVYIIHHAIKAGWLDGTLYLEAHTPIQNNEQVSILNHVDINTAINNATENRTAHINMQLLGTIVKDKIGVPTPIGVEI